MKPIDPQLSPASSHRAWSAVLLLLTSYALVLLSPIAFASLRVASDGIGSSVHVADWVPGTLAVGLALLGGAAMVTVLKRLVRELEFSPYPGVAAAFGVLMGSALIALRAPLHLGALDSGVCAVLCLMVSITGGALALRGSIAATVIGGVVALAPAPLLLLLLSQTNSDQSLQGMVEHLPHADRTFVGLVALFGLLLWLAAVGSRNVRGSSAQRHGVQYWRAPVASPWTEPLAATANEAAPRSAALGGHVGQPNVGARGYVQEDDSRDDPILLTRTKPARAETSAPDREHQKKLDFALAPTVAGPLTPPLTTASEPTSRISVWSFHDAPPRPEDFELPPLDGRRAGVALWLSLIALAAAALGACAWWLMHHA